MANQASMNLLMQSFNMFGNAMAQQREYALQKRKQSLIEMQFNLQQEQAESQAKAFSNATSIIKSLGGEPGQPSLQGPTGAPMELEGVSETMPNPDMPQQEAEGPSDEWLEQQMILAGEQLVKAGYTEQGFNLIGKGTKKTKYERDMAALKKQMEYYKARREGIGAQTDEVKLGYLPQEKEAEIGGKEAQTAKTLQDTQFAGQLQAGRVEAQRLGNMATGQTVNQKGALFPGQMDQQALANQTAMQNLQQNAALFPGQLQGQGLTNQTAQQNLQQDAMMFPSQLQQSQLGAEGQQIGNLQAATNLDQSQRINPIAVQQAQANVGSTLAGTDQTLQQTAQSAATFPTKMAQGQATLAQTQAGTTATQQQTAQSAELQPGRLAQQEATLAATQTSTAGQQQEQEYKRVDRPTEVQNKMLDLQAKKQNAEYQALTHQKMAYNFEREILKDNAGDQVTKDLLAAAAADPKNAMKGHAAKLASVGRYGEALAAAMPQTGTKMVDYLMNQEGMKFQQAMGEWKKWEKKNLNPKLFGAETERRSLSMFNKSYGELTQPQRQQLERAVLDEKIRLKLAENPSLNEKVAIIDTQMDTVNRILAGDAIDLYAGPGRARKGKLWQWLGQEVPEDEAQLHQNIALVRNAYILENSGAATSAEEVGRNFDALFDLTQDPNVVKTRIKNFITFQQTKRQNLIGGAVSSPAPTVPGTEPPPQTPQAPTQQAQPPAQLPAGFQSMSPQGQQQILQMLTPEERKELGM